MTDCYKEKPTENYFGFHQIQHDLCSLDVDYKQKIDTLVSQGVKGVVVNYPFGKENYLKPNARQWQRINDVIDYARSLDLIVWIYDEDGYPSGGAGKLVLEQNPDFEALGLVMFKFVAEKGQPFEFELDAKYEKVMRAYFQVGEEKANLSVLNRKIAFTPEENGRVYIFATRRLFEGTAAEGNGYDKRRYVNLMDKRAIKAFIDVTYQAYYDHIPDFGSKIHAIFTDEPCLIEGYIVENKVYTDAPVSYFYGFENEFFKDHGYRLEENYNSLFEGSQKHDCVVRIDYRNTVSRLVSEAFFEQIQSWCNAHGTKMSGHVNNEEFIHEHVAYYGNLYNCLDKTDMIGLDCLTGFTSTYLDWRYIGTKFVTSLARIRGKADRVMLELCPFVDGKTPDDQNVFGVSNLLWRAGTNYVNSYHHAHVFGDCKAYSEHITALGKKLHGAVQSSGIAVYYPVATMQAKYLPVKDIHWGVYRTNKNAIGKKEDDVRNLAKGIWQHHTDFEFIDDVALNDAEIKNGELTLNGLKFDTVILSGVEFITEAVAITLRKFVSSGGKVLFDNCSPEKIELIEKDGKLSSFVNYEKFSYEKLNYYEDFPLSENPDIFVTKFEKDGKAFYMCVNVSDRENTVNCAVTEQFDFVTAKGESVSPKGDTLVFEPYSVLFAEKRK